MLRVVLTATIRFLAGAKPLMELVSLQCIFRGRLSLIGLQHWHFAPPIDLFFMRSPALLRRANQCHSELSSCVQPVARLAAIQLGMLDGRNLSESQTHQLNPAFRTEQ
jgi:hypothetical protein